jgi:hypothetical protein
MFASLISGQANATVVPATPPGGGTNASTLKILAIEPTVASAPRVRMSFRKFLLLPAFSEVLSSALFESIVRSHDCILGFRNLPNSRIPAARPSSRSTKDTTAAVVRSKFAELGPTGACVEFPTAEKAQAAGGMVARYDRMAKEARIVRAVLGLAPRVAAASEPWCEKPWRDIPVLSS